MNFAIPKYFVLVWRNLTSASATNFAIPKYFVLVWRNLKTPAAATNYIRTTDDLCIVHWSRPPVSQHSTLSHYQSETEILNICTFCRKLFDNRDNYHLYRLQKIVHQQRQLTSALFNDQSIWVSYKTSKLQRKMHSWYAYVTHTYLDVATKTRKLQKNASMTYACVIHACLDVALREGDLRPSVIESKNAKTSLLVYWMGLRQ